jgi:para-nitrobenzyl esterase
MLGDIPVEDILDVAADIGAGKFRPSLDMLNIPRHPFDPAAPQQSVNIPVMIGFTKDEQTLYNVGNPAWLKTTDKQVLAAAEKVAKGEGAAIVADFKAAFPDYDAPHLLMQVTGTVNALRSHHTLAARKAAQPAPVYAYIFAHDIPPDDFVLKAPHTAEIPYIMDNVAVSPLFAGRAEEDHVMGRMMSAAWVNFARTGDPNTEGLPQWPRFNPDTRPTMFLSTDPRVVESPFPEVWRVIQANPAANPRPT